MIIDKLLLNNQILASKPTVQKVRINLVNRQVKKLRKLKKLNEKHPQDKKVPIKITRCTEVLGCLKQTKCNEILRQALLNETNPASIITNGLSTPEEVAQALYFSHKSIAAVVSNLKNILNIHDSDSSWREQVADLSKRKKKQQRTEKKQRFRQERKTRKELDAKRNIWLVENLPERDILSESNADDLLKDEKHISLQSTFHEEEAGTVPDLQKKRKLDKSIAKPEKGAVEPENTGKDYVNSKEKIVYSENETTFEEDETPASENHAVDDFFITQTGEHYLSSAVIDRTQPEPPNDGMVRKERRDAKRGYEIRPTNNRISSIKTWRKQDKLISFGTMEKKNVNIHNKPKNITNLGSKLENGLHPSWAAKQKQKSQIKSFQGSKIIFDSEDTPKIRAKSENGIKSSSTVKNASVEELHPSWAAKQKLKPTITEFKGKKVVFDDD